MSGTSRHIESVGRSIDGRLVIKPAQGDFHYILLAAAGLHWDESLKAIITNEPSDWDEKQWFRHALRLILSEYDIELQTSSKTQWSDISPEVRQCMEDFSASDWAAEFKAEQAQRNEAYALEQRLERSFEEAESQWNDQDYSAFVQTLEPLIEHLSPLLMKKLDIARRRERGAAG